MIMAMRATKSKMAPPVDLGFNETPYRRFEEIFIHLWEVLINVVKVGKYF